MSQTKYIVGSVPNDTNRNLMSVYYIDTRKSAGYDGFSDWFTSTPFYTSATRFDTYQDALDWMDEFLGGEGQIYHINECDTNIKVSLTDLDE